LGHPPQQAASTYTKAQLIEAIDEGVTYQDDDYLIEDEYHNRIEQGYRVRQRWDDTVVSKHRVEWDYYDAPTGNVKDIKTYDIRREEGAVIKRLTVVKHTPDGRVLTWTKEIVETTPQEEAEFGG
jgi:hypothetical protein